MCPLNSMQQDEGFHEIQLNGKQLVFLFMAATVVVVVIFLCGVMVGRGVPAQRILSVAELPEENLDPTTSTQPAPTGAVNTTGLIAEKEKLTYIPRLEDPDPPRETLKPVAPRAESVPVSVERPSIDAAEVVKTTPVPPNYKFQEPAGRGFVVQVAAVRKRAEADMIAQRLRTRGYPSFVTTFGANYYRVRVGKYTNRGTAEETAKRLAGEEHFKPWITR